MNILVTGGLGYIGSHTVVEVINSGHNVIILDNLCNSKRDVHQALEELCGTSIPFYETDILDEAGLSRVFAENDIQGVIHFAALKSVPESLAKPVAYFENNIKGVIHLMRAIAQHKIPYFVFSSSCTVYGEPDQVPVTEDTPTTRSLTPYGNSKLISEMMLEEFTRLTPHVSTAILRYFNPVGAHPSAKIGELPIGIPGNLMPFITQTAAGWREQLKVFGSDYDTRDGTAIRDYIHVVDLAIAHVKSLEWLATQKNVVDFFNLGTGNGCTVMEVVESFERTTGVKLNYAMAPRREGDIEKIWAVTDKAEQVLGWKATRTLDEMTSSAWNWQKTLPNPGN
jgi:UDP-glucose 4-epimerase